MNEEFGVGIVFGFFAAVVVALVLGLVFGVEEAGRNGYCAASGGEYDSSLKACIIDSQVVEVVDWSIPLEEG